MVTWLETQPPRDERPRVFPSPFDDVAPHVLAQRCAELVKADLRTGFIAPGFPTSVLTRAEGGKMFGVLVVESAEGRVGFLRAVSGQVERAWRLEGYAPPVFDVEQRVASELPAEVMVKGLTARVELARVEPTLLAARAALAQVDARHAEKRVALKAQHSLRKQERRLAREATTDTAALHALDQLSRKDDHERRSAEAAAREERAAALATLFPLERRLAALERLRRIVSQETMRLIWDSYQLTNFAGQTTTLRALFPGEIRPLARRTARLRSCSRPPAEQGFVHLRWRSSGGVRLRRAEAVSRACSFRRAARSAVRCCRFSSAGSRSRRARRGSLAR